MFEFKGKFNNYFKKSGKEKMPQQDPSKHEEHASQHPPSPDNKVTPTEINRAKKKAIERIKDFEEKVSQERESWALKIKSREEERITLEAQISQLEKMAQIERERRDLELNNSKDEARAEIGRLEQYIVRQEKQWDASMQKKEHAVEELKNKEMLEAAQEKLVQEEKRRHQEEELRDLNQEFQDCNAELKAERSLWMSEIRKKDEQNISLHTKLSLLDSRTKGESTEGDRKYKKEQETGAHRIGECEQRLVHERREYQQAIEKKLAEISAIRERAEKRKDENNKKIEMVEAEYHNEQQKIHERIARLQKQLMNEKETWDRMFHHREDEFNKLKMQTMLLETQEKTDDEKRKDTWKKMIVQCERHIKSLERTIEEESMSAAHELQREDDELEALKIEAALSVHDLQKEWERKQKELANQKVHLEGELKNCEHKINEESTFWENQIRSKDDDMVRFRNDLAARMEQERILREKGLDELNLRKNELEKELRSIDDQYMHEKRAWERQLEEKDRILLSDQRKLQVQKEHYEHECTKVEKDLQRLHAPLIKQVEEMNQLLEQKRHAGEKALQEKECWLDSCRTELARQEELTRQKLFQQCARIEDETHDLERRIEAVRCTRKDEGKKDQEKLKNTDNEISRFRAELNALVHTGETEKESIRATFRGQKQHLEKELKLLTMQRKDQEKEISLKQDECDKEIKHIKDELTAKKDSFDAEMKKQADCWMRQKGQLEEEFRKQESKYNQMSTQAAIDNERQAKELQKLIDSKTMLEERCRDELDAIHAANHHQLNPYVQQKDELGKMIRVEKDQWSVRLEESGRLLGVLNQERAKTLKSIEEEKQNFNLQYDRLREEIKKKVAEAMSRVRVLEETIQHEIENRESEKENIRSQYHQIHVEHKERLEQCRQTGADDMQARKAEIEALSNSLHFMQQQWPSIVRTRQEDIQRLKDEIAQCDNYLQTEEKKWRERFSDLKAKGESQINTIQKQIETLKNRKYDVEKQKNDEIGQLKLESEKFISEREEHIRQEGRRFTEEKFRLQKEIEELQWNIKDHEDVTTKQLENKNIEIQKLKEAGIQRERVLQERTHALKEQYAHKNEECNAELKHLQEKLQTDRSETENFVRQKDNQMRALKEDAQKRIHELQRDVGLKKKNWEEVINHLTQEQKSLSSYWDEKSVTWTGIVRTKDKQRAVLRDQLVKIEEECRSKEQETQKKYEDETVHIRAEISEQEQESSRIQEELSAQSRSKEEELKALERQCREKEDALHEDITSQEREYGEEQTRLEAAVDLLQSDIKRGEREHQEQITGIEKIISGLMLDLSTKNVQSDLHIKKFEREHRGVRRQLDEVLAGMKRKIQQVRQDCDLEMRLKDDGIKNLNERLMFRSSRLTDEWENRRATLEDIKNRLTVELQELEAALACQGHDHDELLAERQKVMRELKAELASLPEFQTGAFKRRLETLRSKEQVIRDSINAVEEQGDIEKAEFTDRMRKKKIEEEMLQQEIRKSDELIGSEVSKTQSILRSAMDKAIQIKESFRNKFSTHPEDNKEKKANTCFKTGTQYYHDGQFEKAIIEFEKTHHYNPALWTAFQYQGLCYERLGMVPEALIAGEKALSIQPRNNDLRAWVKQLKETIED